MEPLSRQEQKFSTSVNKLRATNLVSAFVAVASTCRFAQNAVATRSAFTTAWHKPIIVVG
jgi:hypothetical protein